MSNLLQITAQNFDDVIAQHSLLVIDFSAQWCAPCVSFSKVIEQVAEEFPEVAFGMIDIEKSPELAAEFHVQSVPAVMIMRSQVVVYADSGAISADNLRHLLNQAKALTPDQLQ